MGADPEISAHFAGHMASFVAIDGGLSTFVASPSQPTRRMAASSVPSLSLRFIIRCLEPSFPGLMQPACAGDTSLPSFPAPVPPIIEFRSGIRTCVLPPFRLRLTRQLDFGSITWLGKPELSLPWRFVRPVIESCHDSVDSRNKIVTNYPQRRTDSVHKKSENNF
jgi:hypothetical protein